MEAYCYLGFCNPFGAALPGWSPGAFKVEARERWLDGLPEQQFRRLHPIANNARFLVLPGFRVPNLASRVLGLSARRRRWAASRQEPGGTLALDGKAASERTEGPNPERVLITTVAASNK